MNRLTRKVNDEQLKEAKEFGEPFVREYEENDYCELEGTYDKDRLNKLGQLEDIEDELGLPLINLFKIIECEFFWWQRSKNNTMCRVRLKDIDFSDKVIYFCLPESLYGNAVDHSIIEAPFEYYGETWALTTEELEHE